MFVPENEMGVIVVFSRALEFEILDVRVEFPDVRFEHKGEIYLAEFEYKSSSFRIHGHDPRGCDLVICWEKDEELGELPILELSNPDWVNQSIELSSDKDKELLYWKLRAERAESRLKQYNLVDKMHSGESLNDDEKLSLLARMLIQNGESFSEHSLAGNGNPLAGRNEYVELRKFWLDKGYLKPKIAGSPRQGWELTETGAEMLSSYL
jgi:hypothetical protein